MTAHEKRLTEVILGQLKNLSPQQAAEQLLRTGMLNLRTCEQLAVREQIAQCEKQGMGRVEAMEVTAMVFNCSFAKVRDIYYIQFKSRKQ